MHIVILSCWREQNVDVEFKYLRCFKKLSKCKIKNKDNIDWKVCVSSDIFLQNWWGMTISLNYPNVFNLVSFSLQSLFPTSVKLSFSRASFYVPRIITWLSWICVIVVQNYVLMFLRIELEGSLTAFTAGASNSNLSKNATSENSPFCGCVNLRSRYVMVRQCYVNADLQKELQIMTAFFQTVFVQITFIKITNWQYMLIKQVTFYCRQ